MQKVFLVADSEQKQQCRAMGASQRNLDDELARLAELKAYRESYAAQCRLGQYMSTQWKDYQSFLNRLDKAVEIQTQVVMDGKLKRDAHRSRWMSKRRKAESLERVVERFRLQQVDNDERVEQKTSDDFAGSRNRFGDA